jgi:hypothetical protein
VLWLCLNSEGVHCLFVNGCEMLIGLHQFLIFFPLHLLEHLLVIRQTLLVDHLPDLPFDPASDHTIDRVLLALDCFHFWLFFD